MGCMGCAAAATAVITPWLSWCVCVATIRFAALLCSDRPVCCLQTWKRLEYCPYSCALIVQDCVRWKSENSNMHTLPMSTTE